MAANITLRMMRDKTWTLTATATGLKKEVAEALALSIYNAAPGPKVSEARVARPWEERKPAASGKEG